MALAADLAGSGRPAELVGADALQACREVSIGTAKPGPRARCRVRHHLIDVLAPHQRFSAGEFARRAAVAIEGIETRRRQPIVVGGSGFYLRSLFEGLAPVPRIPPELQARLRSELEASGLPALVAELRECDPDTAEVLAPGDTQRVLRALEVVRATGTPLSKWQRRGVERRLDRPVLRVGLTLPRAVLYDAIEARAVRMLESGWLAEVERLRRYASARGGWSRQELPALQALGYRQLGAHLDGQLTLEQALEQTVRATRRYARRQETWFRRETGVFWVDASDAGALGLARRRIVAAVTGSGLPETAAPAVEAAGCPGRAAYGGGPFETGS